jgi:hypothetical protein
VFVVGVDEGGENSKNQTADQKLAVFSEGDLRAAILSMGHQKVWKTRTMTRWDDRNPVRVCSTV